MDSLGPPIDPQQRREWIKFQLRLRGITLSAIARELGVSRQALRLALIQSYPKMERAIATKLNMTPESIWPERYAHRRPLAADKVPRQSCHVKSTKHNIAGPRRKRR